MTDDGLTATQQALVFVAIGTKDPLRDHFAEQKKRQRETWRVSEQKLKAERLAIDGLAVNFVKKNFIDMAKSQLLTQEEVMIGTYVLFGNSDAQKFFGYTYTAQERL